MSINTINNITTDDTYYIEDYRVSDYFIDVDENSDITTLLNNAIENGYTNIFLPNRKYKISNIVEIPSNFILNGGLLEFTENTSIYYYFSINGVDNVQFRNMKIDCNNVQRNIFSHSKDNWTKSTNVLFENCHFSNTYNTGVENSTDIIHLRDCQLTLKNCSFNSCGYYESGEQETNQMACVSCGYGDTGYLTVENCSFNAYWVAIYSSVNTYINNCVFNNAIDNAFYSSSEHYNLLKIENCLFNENLLDEVIVCQGSKVDIVNNVFNSCGVACINMINGCDIINIERNYFNNVSTIAPIYRMRDYDTVVTRQLNILNNVIFFASGRSVSNDYFRIGFTYKLNFVGNSFTFYHSSDTKNNPINYLSSNTNTTYGVIADNFFDNRQDSAYPYLLQFGLFKISNNVIINGSLLLESSYIISSSVGDGTFNKATGLLTPIGATTTQPRIFKTSNSVTGVPSYSSYHTGDIVIVPKDDCLYYRGSSGWIKLEGTLQS